MQKKNKGILIGMLVLLLMLAGCGAGGAGDGASAAGGSASAADLQASDPESSEDGAACGDTVSAEEAMALEADTVIIPEEDPEPYFTIGEISD